MGISKYGPKPIVAATIVLPNGTQIDLTPRFIDHFGAAPEVTAQEGRIARPGDCPSCDAFDDGAKPQVAWVAGHSGRHIHV